MLMQTFRKYLVYEYVPIMESTFRSDTRESCVTQRSIYIILRGNEETRRYINQVRSVLRSCFQIGYINQVKSVLRHLMSNIEYEFTVMQGKPFDLFVSLIFFETTSKCIFCTTVKSHEFTILKFSCINFSGLKLTNLISRDKWSFILHGHNKLPLLFHFVTFLWEEDQYIDIRKYAILYY